MSKEDTFRTHRDCSQLSSKLSAASKGLQLSEEESKELEAELQAFRLVRIPESKATSFAFTFPELLYVPNQTQIRPPVLNQQVIEHWRKRSQSEANMHLRARYAELVWDLERFSTTGTDKRDYLSGKLAAESYLAAANQGFYELEIVALMLSIGR